MHEFETFLHLLQRLSYFGEASLYADEVRDFHCMHYLQSSLVRVKSLKSITKGQATKTQCMDERQNRKKVDRQHQTEKRTSTNRYAWTGSHLDQQWYYEKSITAFTTGKGKYQLQVPIFKSDVLKTHELNITNVKHDNHVRVQLILLFSFDLPNFNVPKMKLKEKEEQVFGERTIGYFSIWVTEIQTCNLLQCCCFMEDILWTKSITWQLNSITHPAGSFSFQLAKTESA